MTQKPIRWVGTSYRDLRDFPREARRKAGHALHLVQNGLTPADFKPFGEIGPGTYGIRISTDQGGEVQHRVFYVARFPEAVYVLHAFRKTTGRTSRDDREVGQTRYREMMEHRRKIQDPEGR